MAPSFLEVETVPAVTKTRFSAYEDSPAIQPQFHPGHYNIGTVLAHRMEELGVTDYFVVPGDYNLTLLDQILKNKSLRMVGCCNELNAGYAADGYARSSPSKVAVVFVTFMVGGLSVINAIAGAYSENLRVIVVSGCPPQETFGQDRMMHHTLGINDREQPLQMFAKVTTASVRLTTKNDPIGTLDSAITRCLEDSLPVYIEIPSNISQFPCPPPTPLIIPQPIPARRDSTRAAVETIRPIWEAAEKPILMVGARVRQTVSTATLVALVDKLGCAVFVQPDAKSLIPEDHPQFAGTFWSASSNVGCEEAVLRSDLWVMMGCRWTDFHTLGSYLDLSKESSRILDLQDGYITTPGGESLKGIGLDDTIQAIIASDIPRKDTTCRPLPLTPTTPHGSLEGNSSLSIAAILQGIQRIITPKDTLIAETGDSWFNAQTIQLPNGADYQMQMVYGSIGWSLPATMGYQIGRPDGRVITMIGDGSFQMTAQEVSTMIRARTNSIIFIFNNLGYAIETAIHDGPYNYYNNWNYTAFAQSLCNMFHAPYVDNPHVDPQINGMGMNPPMFAMQIKTTAELRIALDRVEQEPTKLAILECCIPPGDVSSTLISFGTAVGQAPQS
ncbi:thiamine diphosphate-binding protein [Aspergillus coremiiformis]|uniref:Pyruvate decarboxylase n=1 Tax=Aspergillus coremiiformis TaxID=138285 RepID=A0A5N6ZHM1_9EURO|nr:thiamine diphosphate-binding protein [Aspergillus coremiiformis]